MSSVFDTAFNAIYTPACEYNLAEEIVYTKAGQSAGTATAVVRRESRKRVFDDSFVASGEEIIIDVLASDVPSPVGIAEASGSLDSAVIDSTTFYVVETIEKNVNGWHVLRLDTKALPR